MIWTMLRTLGELAVLGGTYFAFCPCLQSASQCFAVGTRQMMMEVLGWMLRVGLVETTVA